MAKKRTTQIKKFMKQLTLIERATLAEEIGCSYTYLHHLASKLEAGEKLARRVHYSKFNRSLPEERQYTYEAFMSQYWDERNAAVMKELGARPKKAAKPKEKAAPKATPKGKAKRAVRAKSAA